MNAISNAYFISLRKNNSEINYKNDMISKKFHKYKFISASIFLSLFFLLLLYLITNMNIFNHERENANEIISFTKTKLEKYRLVLLQQRDM